MQSHIDIFGLGLVLTIIVAIWLYGAYMHKHSNTTYPDEMLIMPKFICILFGNFGADRRLHYPTIFAQLIFLIFGIIYSLFELGWITRRQENDGLFWLVVVFSLIAIGITVLRRKR